MKRHHAILTTPTTAGGRVISASSFRSISGVKVALEGDKVYCPACKSEGVIRGQGPRLPEQFNGVTVALEHDLCICRCSTPPLLLAGQATSWQTVDGGAFARVDTARAVAAGAAESGHRSRAARFDEQSHLDVETGYAEGLPYHIEVGTEVLSGRVDSTGRLPRVSTWGADQYRVWVGDQALDKMHGRIDA